MPPGLPSPQRVPLAHLGPGLAPTIGNARTCERAGQRARQDRRSAEQGHKRRRRKAAAAAAWHRQPGKVPAAFCNPGITSWQRRGARRRQAGKFGGPARTQSAGLWRAGAPWARGRPACPRRAPRRQPGACPRWTRGSPPFWAAGRPPPAAVTRREASEAVAVRWPRHRLRPGRT